MSFNCVEYLLSFLPKLNLVSISRPSKRIAHPGFGRQPVAVPVTSSLPLRPFLCLLVAIRLALIISPLHAQTAIITATPVVSGFSLPSHPSVGVAVDGSGNIYVTDIPDNAVKEMPPGCATSSCATTLGGGFNDPTGVAVDSSGNVYVADYGNKAVKEMPAGCTSSTCVTSLGRATSMLPTPITVPRAVLYLRCPRAALRRPA